MAKFRSEEYESHKRLAIAGGVCITKQSPYHPKVIAVYVADIWNERL
ncbi:hypothetical protein G8W03_04340, partial [Clostridium botulinum D/C]|nr:hypothetical protein [Clostridium botulinum D/C]